MFPKLGLRQTSEQSGRKKSLPTLIFSYGKERTISTRGSSDMNSSPGDVDQKNAEPIEIKVEKDIYSLEFLDENHVVSRHHGERQMRLWRVKDGEDVRTSLDAGDEICSISVSTDGEWVASGTKSGRVVIWNATSLEKVTEFEGYGSWPVYAMDFSRDKTRIATGSFDKTVEVWSLPTGKKLLGPFKHDSCLAAVKLSPDGQFLATATWDHSSVRIYRNHHQVFEFPIQVFSQNNQTLAWANNSEQLFVLSRDGEISCLDVTSGSTLSTWPIHSSDYPCCIALSSDGTVIAASSNSSISFWDVTTHRQLGPVVNESHKVDSMTILATRRIATAGKKTITVRDLSDILPPPYCGNVLNRSLHSSPVDTRAYEEAVKSTDAEASSQGSDNTIALLNTTIQELRDERDGLNKTIRSLRTELHMRETSAADNERSLRNQLSKSKHAAGEEDKKLNQIITSLRVDCQTREERANAQIAQLQDLLAASQRAANEKVDRLTQIVLAHEQRHQCEALYAQGRVREATLSLPDIANNVGPLKDNGSMSEWMAGFQKRCTMALEKDGDEALRAEKHEKALDAYSTALSLSPSNEHSTLTKWLRLATIQGSVRDALNAAEQFKRQGVDLYRIFCSILEGDGRVMDAIECFERMKIKLRQDLSGIGDEQAQWDHDFRQRCIQELERLGGSAADSNKHTAAITYYAHTLALGPANENEIVIKCCQVRAGWLKQELVEADKDIARLPSSYKGYERRHAALRRVGRFREAAEAFQTMLSTIDLSPDLEIRKLGQRYVDVTPTIRRLVQHTIRSMPRVLINTNTGQLHDKVGQASMFEGDLVFNELRSSMTTGADEARIRREVKKYYRYAMLSHRWEDDEPLFQAVEGISVYDLAASSANLKLQSFCKLARSLGFQWVWSDTCCIDRSNNVVLQESMVAMFTWYRGSSLTIIYLRGVFSMSQKPGALRKSIWNTRAWTYQEYVAAEIVQFYTEDWKPYLGLTMYNHKECPQVMLEMQQAAGALVRELAVLRPDLDRVREKLYVASRRETTVVEDAAYSLFGIFNAAIPVIYGEGDRAVGRLLEHVLTGSGDVTILAWTGQAGTYNSCLPVDLIVYEQLEPPHISPSIDSTEMNTLVTALRSSLPDLSEAVMLHAHLNDLPSPFLTSSRLRIHGIVFPVAELVRTTTAMESDDVDDVAGLHAYRATTAMLGDVEFQSTDDLSGMIDLVFVHPWISPLLDQDFSRGVETDPVACALRLVARLRQPFGALLLAPITRVQYRRVATDSLIMVRIQEEASLGELMSAIRPVDVQ